MSRPKPWLKMWVEWIHDAKMLRLSLAEVGVWWKVVSLAGECNADGRLIKGPGMPLTLEEIADCLHIKGRDFGILKSMITKMQDQGSMHWNDQHTLVVTHYAQRQELMASSTKEAVRDRVRRHRQQPVTENSLQEEGGVLATIAQLYEKNCGLITPMLAEQFKEFSERFKGPVEWVHSAFAEAVRRNARNWAYVETILNTWQIEGRQPNARPGIRKSGRDPAGGWPEGIKVERDEDLHDQD